VGLGGHDLKVYRKAQMNHSYALLPVLSGVPTGIAVQYGNYEEMCPQTAKRVTIDEIYRFGKDLTTADYLFSSVQEPHFTRDLLAMMSARPTTESAQESCIGAAFWRGAHFTRPSGP
jgi:hypothetical protein